MKLLRSAYTAEFKDLAVSVSRPKSCRGGTGAGRARQMLRNWGEAASAGKLDDAVGKAVAPEDMELSRLRAENGKLKRRMRL